MSPRLPLASRQDILDELADIRRERDTIGGNTGDRADEQRACLDWWEQDLEEQLQEMPVDLTLRCPTCGRRADVCFDHGDQWKKRSVDRDVHRMTEHELRASVNEFTGDDPPPYGAAR
jgi:hypothetical protein